MLIIAVNQPIGFPPITHDMSLGTRTLLTALRAPSLSDELKVYYQPIIRLRSGSILGYEALLRWDHPALGMISPDIFITFAEQHELMSEITQILFKKVIQDQACWNHNESTMISLNISAQTLTDDDLLKLLNSLVSGTQVSNKQVMIEITETATLTNPQKARTLIKELSKEGFSFALDDFGTGYSSLTNLRDLQVNEIKIDKSFIQNIDDHSHADQVLIDAILSIAHAFGSYVVAEGIETQQTLALLKSMNCYAGQGYLFAKPMPATEIDSWYEQWPYQWRQLAHRAKHTVI